METRGGYRGGPIRPGSRPANLPSTTIRPAQSGIIIDGVAYTKSMIRTIILERHQMASEMALIRDTLRLSAEALNRLAEEAESRRQDDLERRLFTD